MDTQVSSSSVTKQRANEILMMAYKELEAYPSLRLGQAIVNVSTREDWAMAWPELFNEECPVKASELFYSIVENNGKRELTGSLCCGTLFTLPENRH